jgi:hypothetical protein
MPIINAPVGEKRLLIVGGVYRLATGQVDGLRALFTATDEKEEKIPPPPPLPITS